MKIWMISWMISFSAVSETVETEVKEQRGRFLFVLASTLGAGFTGNMLEGKEVIRVDEGAIRVGHDF